MLFVKSVQSLSGDAAERSRRRRAATETPVLRLRSLPSAPLRNCHPFVKPLSFWATTSCGYA